ncbi:MAG: hypothetical protein QME12_05935 [Nanoarchaeota archaeon]|nr:hypothetical protein [Nanoarchaeota archaeon]
MLGMCKERIIKVLFLNKQPLSKYKVSKEAGASFSWTHEFLQELERLKLVSGTKVKDVNGLINYWLGFRKAQQHREYMVQEPLNAVKKAGLKYAITTYYAENIVQQFLFPSRLDIYIREEDLGVWHKALTKSGLYGKGNIRVLIDSSGLFKAEKIKGISIVCLPQLIVDLKKEGGPCEEAAEMLIERLKKDVCSI